MCQDLTWIIEVVSRNINTSDFTCPVPKSCHSCTVKKCDAMFCVCRLTCRFVKSYRWGCDVHRDEYLLLFLILLFFFNWCGRGWMLRVCFCSLSLSLFSGQIITATCSLFVRACLRPRGYWGSSEFARSHTSPLLQTELCACLSCRDNSCVLAVANWVSAWTVDGYCSRLRFN